MWLVLSFLFSVGLPTEFILKINVLFKAQSKILDKLETYVLCL
jgi:hypothetical protein